MNLEKELREMLDDINIQLRGVKTAEAHTNLMQTKATVLVGLQKYEETHKAGQKKQKL